MSVRMKGFVHVIEIIIVVLAMFVVLGQLVGTPRIDTDWSAVSMSTKLNDILHSLDAAGLDWFDSVAVKRAINGTLNTSNIIYRVQIKNVLKPQIITGCICYNEGELGEVRAALENPPVDINGQHPRFVGLHGSSVDNITGEFEGGPDLPFGYDVIIVMDKNISYNKAFRYLAQDGGIVEVRDLSLGLAGQNANQLPDRMGDVHNKLFGIEYVSAVSPGSNDLFFTGNAKMVGGNFYNIYSYFYNIPNSTLQKINETHHFTGLLGGNNERMNITTLAYNSAQGIIREDITGAPALVLNSFMAEGKGRTAWLSYPESGSLSTNDDMSVLLKALAFWASGETYDVVPAGTMNSPTKAVLYKVLNTNLMQPIEVSLTMGTIY
jgi:hypothetical protein